MYEDKSQPCANCRFYDPKAYHYFFNHLAKEEKVNGLYYRAGCQIPKCPCTEYKSIAST